MSDRGRSTSPKPLQDTDRDVDMDMDKSDAKPDAKVVIITNLTRNVVEGHLRTVFGFYGEIMKIDLPVYGKSGQNRGKAALEFAAPAEAHKAASHMNGGQLDDHEMEETVLGRIPGPSRVPVRAHVHVHALRHHQLDTAAMTTGIPSAADVEPGSVDGAEEVVEEGEETSVVDVSVVALALVRLPVEIPELLARWIRKDASVAFEELFSAVQPVEVAYTFEDSVIHAVVVEVAFEVVFFVFEVHEKSKSQPDEKQIQDEVVESGEEKQEYEPG
ncbi:hypothetical protein V5O48_001222 [Marasmius crinis-equi]|uniref:RRM domain-containing protein n=1 Tax=Marasmius crinis-equi TaxID=585013 RepID=A0ABR3FZB2_9AGAR